MTENILYLDCFTGISGDMATGALLDCGVPDEFLAEQLSLLDLKGYKLRIDRNAGQKISSVSFRVEAEGSQHPRNWQDIHRIINSSQLADKVKDLAVAIFTTLAEAESIIHGCDIKKVHFHEVGAVDSIIDIVSFAVCYDYLDINQVVCSPLPMPGGMISCDHGLLPLPAPAVCEILKGVPVFGVDLDQEMVTPTGAAIVKTICRSFGSFPPMTISQVGYGRGSYQLADGRPNLLRAVTGKSRSVSEAQEVEIIECNIDDWSPEGFPYLSEELFEIGALDVVLVPIHMKKGRPGFQVQVLCPPGLGWEIQRCLLTETTAIGIRMRTEQRWTLPRQVGTIETSLGTVGVKLVETPDGDKLYPEYESCRRLAHQKNIALKDVYNAVNRCRPDDFRPEGN